MIIIVHYINFNFQLIFQILQNVYRKSFFSIKSFFFSFNQILGDNHALHLNLSDNLNN